MMMFSIRPIIGAKKGYFRCCDDNRKKDFQFNLTKNLPVYSCFFLIMLRMVSLRNETYFRYKLQFYYKI